MTPDEKRERKNANARENREILRKDAQMASQGKPGNRVVHLECTRPSQMAHRSQNQVGGHVADLSSVPHVSEWKTLGDKGHPDDETITHTDIERAVNELRRLKGFTEPIKWRK